MKISSKFRKSDGDRLTPYTYYCVKCDEEEDLYYSMNDERPLEYDCPFCSAKNSMRRLFGKSSVIIPHYFTEDKGKSIKFDKRPSGKRRLYPIERTIS